jgi:RHH-type proline utilization regulon transcriptional repressor/proline dehydrogenase/delta 1-pyrroline-5-carboxylate dehydrogenase
MFESLRSYHTDAGSRINHDYLTDETPLIERLAAKARSPDDQKERIRVTAEELVNVMRRDRASKSGIDAFLNQYDLSSTEGVVLMCLAEALLRIPDAETADALIADRLAAGDWAQHLGESDSLFVNASTWGLMLTGKLIRPDAAVMSNPINYMRNLAGRIGEPVVRTAMMQAMRIMGEQFVMGRNIDAALERSDNPENLVWRYSYDMLGEAALTEADARGYFDAYAHAIEKIGAHNTRSPAGVLDGAGISIKLSALTPRLDYARLKRVVAQVAPRLLELVVVARQYGVSVTVDAEEAARLELTLAIFQKVFRDEALGDWEGFGLAVQAYQRRAASVIGWLQDLSQSAGRRIPTRLVKGAYWDTEIKSAQELGLSSYPVFTRKVNTDVSYLACTHALWSSGGRLLPQFATHNAHTVAFVMHTAPSGAEFEFQRLHGMGEALYDHITQAGQSCRVYAPVGRHEDLLPYLVRRLLENGANTSFVNRIVQEQAPVDDLIRDPVDQLSSFEGIPNPRIPEPPHLFGSRRLNAEGLNLMNGSILDGLANHLEAALKRQWHAGPLVDGIQQPGAARQSLNPADHRQVVGVVDSATPVHVEQAVRSAAMEYLAWNATKVSERAGILRRAADLYEQHRAELMALCIAEAGKSIPAALAEIREAIDFLRYYAAEAERTMSAPTVMPGPTGERNELELTGRGVFVCISPWNFPLAIFTGQVAAALVAGNAVLAKPAEQTGLIAFRAVQLMHEAGVPPGVLHFLPGDGAVGSQAVAHESIAGVAFTGSTATAQSINRALAAREGPLAVLVAETGGQNAMIVDSTALTEQVVRDVVQSAFDSAGQRCSALRVLYLQDDIADAVTRMLAGHMAELRIGDPASFDTDVGPVIDTAARDALLAHRDQLIRTGRVIHECELPSAMDSGSFVAPIAIEIPSISILNKEHFGPILHVIRYRRNELNNVLGDITATGYGLTMGLQTRIEHRALALARRAPAGNIYINRNMIGAVVGVQPFGGRGLSGTGPKAGGPNYLLRFTTERTVTVNTAAIGGNASLLASTED